MCEMIRLREEVVGAASAAEGMLSLGSAGSLFEKPPRTFGLSKVRVGEGVFSGRGILLLNSLNV